MIKEPKISLILPTLNEENNIVELVERIEKCLPQICEIYIVDDGSKDRTIDQINSLKSNFANIHLIQRNEQGLLSAIKRGIKESKAPLVAWMDCDLSHPPELLTAMYDYCTWMNADCVLASRYLPSSIDKTHQGKLFIKIHKLLSFMLNKICQFLISSQITDYTSGYIMVHRKRLETIDYSGDYGEYFMELLWQLKNQKCSIFEVPFYSPPRQHGQSKTATHIFGLFLNGQKYLRKIISITLVKLFRMGS